MRFPIESNLVKQSNSEHDSSFWENCSFPSFSVHERKTWKFCLEFLNCNHHHHQYYCPCYCCYIWRVSSFRLHFFMLRYGNMIYENTSEVRVNRKRYSNKHEKNDSMTIVNYRFFSSFHFRFFLLFFLLKLAIFGSCFSLFLSCERNKIMLFSFSLLFAFIYK